MNHTTLTNHPELVEGRMTRKLKQLSISIAMVSCLATTNKTSAMSEHILACGSDDGTIKILDISDLTKNGPIRKKTLAQGTYGSVIVTFSPTDKNILASASHTGTVKIWDLSGLQNPLTHGLIQTLTHRATACFAMAFNHFDKNIFATTATNAMTGTIKIWNIETGAEQKTLTGHGDMISSIAFSPFDKNILASGSRDGKVKIWNISNPDGQECIKTITFGSNLDWVNSLAFDLSEKNKLAVGSADGEVKIFDISLPDGQEHVKTQRKVVNHSYWVHSLALNNRFDENTLASTESHNIVIWNPTTGNHKKPLTGHGSFVMSLAFSTFNKNILASASCEKTIKIWDLSRPEGQELVTTLGGFDSEVCSVAFAPRLETEEQERFKKNLVKKTEKVEERWPINTGFGNGKVLNPPFSDLEIKFNQ